MKFNRWDDSKIDTRLYLQLQDLTSTLSNMPELKFEYRHGSFIDTFNEKVSGSHLWDVSDPSVRISGYKTDLFLRTLGTLGQTDIPSLKNFLQRTTELNIEKFAVQLVTLLEDMRLEEIITKTRPGTKRDFTIRRSYLKHFFETQLATNVTRSYPLDELFCLIYLLLQSDKPDPVFPRANERQVDHLESLKPLLYQVFDAKKSCDITIVAEQIVCKLANDYTDMINTYFAFPISNVEEFEMNTLFDELTRTDELENEDMEDANQDDSEYFDETFSTWHQENQNSDRKQNFLQFELESGTKTNILGGGTRETEDADQAMGTIQGASGESEKNDYSEVESLKKQATKQSGHTNGAPYGEENRYAVAIDKQPISPSADDELAYRNIVNDIEAHKRRLSTTIQKVLEHKRNSPRKDLLFGRLSKNLMPIVTDENPRIFYKKNDESNDIDAVFTLLVDCSASMHDKMDKTKRGIVLFHEVLKELRIPHSIVGFWEDANDVKDKYQPNYFHQIQSYSDSIYQNTGPRIMQLEPQEDNRDGFAIKVINNELAARHEKNKFLLVFSDGEPAAANYDQNGIIDTNLAVSEGRKQGINVIGMFLSDGEIDEQEDNIMQNIYGKERLMVPAIEELPEHFAPLLKKLLLRSI
ncbi:vWA domain-containing protein [Virgibacillus doumboii]|uniref:vWA domain-containing protein n=1 Tax=Virgibacillus doumboii TaxID=2697503 RepID=UPI0013DEF98C|nr:VWA domain-containing protein [Virgibacillus doumboii]